MENDNLILNKKQFSETYLKMQKFDKYNQKNTKQAKVEIKKFTLQTCTFYLAIK